MCHLVMHAHYLVVAQWRSGAVAQWRSGAVAQWRSGAVAQWRSGAMAKANPWLTFRTSGKFVYPKLIQLIQL